jgi:dihydroflavonol-4-reductase
VPGDVTKPEGFRSALAGCEVVIHTAAAWSAGVNARQRARLQAINVEGTRAVLDAALAARVGRVLHVSSASVYGAVTAPAAEGAELPEGNIQTEYQRTKRAGHALARARATEGAPVVIAVPGVTFGPGDASRTGEWLHRLRAGRLWWAPGPDCRRNWAHVTDVVRGLRLALELGEPGATYHLGGDPLSVREFLGRAARSYHQPEPRVWVSSAMARRLAQLFGDRWPAQAERWRPWAGVSYLLDTTRTRSALDWTPRAVAVLQPHEWLGSL